MRRKKVTDGTKLFLNLFGGIWAAVGSIFFVGGIVLLLGLDDTPWRSAFLPLLFMGIGAVFAAGGFTIILFQVDRGRRKKRLLESGRRIYAEVAEVFQDSTMMINGNCMWRVSCRYQDGQGVIHIFRSDRLNFDPSGLLTGNMVPVYIEDGRPDRYVVDLQAVLPQIELH